MNGQFLGCRSIRTNWATRKPPSAKAEGNYHKIRHLLKMKENEMRREKIIDTTCFCFRWESSKHIPGIHTQHPPAPNDMEALFSKLFVTVSRSEYVVCLLISTKWIIIHNDMNLYTLLINQCCRLNIIYLYVCSLDITSPRDITNVFMKTSNQNRNTYTLVKVVSSQKKFLSFVSMENLFSCCDK